MVTTSHCGEPCLGKSVEHASSHNDNSNDYIEESIVVSEKNGKCGLETMTKYSEGAMEVAKKQVILE